MGDDDAPIGRERELRLVAALLAALPDAGRVPQLSGAPGTGRSTILRYAADAARRGGIRVLTTSGVPAERELPFAALHRLLRPFPLRQGDPAGGGQALLDRAFTGSADPDVGPAVGPVAGPVALTPARVAQAVLRLLVSAPGPVLVAVDDLEQLDDASRDVVRELARPCAAIRVGVILAARAAYPPLVPGTMTAVLGPLPAPQARALAPLGRGGSALFAAPPSHRWGGGGTRQFSCSSGAGADPTATRTRRGRDVPVIFIGHTVRSCTSSRPVGCHGTVRQAPP